MMDFTQIEERNKKWFKDIQLFSRFLGKYEYFGTFNFDREWLKNIYYKHTIDWNGYKSSSSDISELLKKNLANSISCLR